MKLMSLKLRDNLLLLGIATSDFGIMASFQTILSNTGWSVVAKIASISMQIFPSLFKMTANRRGGFPDLYFLVHILLTVRKFHVHGYATHLRPVVHFVLLASCCDVLITMLSLVLVIATGKMLFVGWKDMKTVRAIVQQPLQCSTDLMQRIA